MSMNDADVQTVVERYTRRFVEFDTTRARLDGTKANRCFALVC